MKDSGYTHMDNKTDITVLILRFIFGIILGALFSVLLTVPFIYVFDILIPTRLILIIGGIITLISGIFAVRWGDRFIVWFMNIFKMFKYW